MRMEFNLVKKIVTMFDVKNVGYLHRVRLHRMPDRRTATDRFWQRLEEY